MDSLHVIPKSLLGDPVGMVGSGREAEIKRALGYALDLPELKVISKVLQIAKSIVEVG